MNTGWTLAIETSGRMGSVAIGRGDMILGVEQFSADMRHAVELLPTMDRLCRAFACPPDQIAIICISIGPGSFTGLRIGVTVARTLAWAGGAKIAAVPTLDVIAQNAQDLDPRPQNLGVVLDAKRGHIFAAPFRFHDGAYSSLAEPMELDPGAFARSLPIDAALIGEGLSYHRAILENSGRPFLPDHLNRARAETVYQLGMKRAGADQFADPATLTPIYIRRPEAEEKWEEKREGSEGPRVKGS